jgi:Skp family chaperone for outer membrane proteins
MTDNQQAASGTQRLLHAGTVTLTVLSPVINMLAARLADRLEQGGKHPEDFNVVDVEDKPNVKKVVFANGEQEEVVVVKQPISDVLQGRGEVLVQELEDLVERGTKLSQSLMARGSEVTHDLVERGNNASQDLLRRSKEVREELGERGKKLNKDLNRRSQKVAKELNKRSQKVAKELNRRSQQATRQISERSGTFWVIAGFAVGLSAAGITAYLLIRQRVRQQQQLEEEQSYPVSQNGYLNIHASSSVQAKDAASSAGPIVHQPTASALVEENVPAVAVVEQENRMPAAQSAPSNAAFIGVVGTRRYYPVATPLEQLAVSGTGKNDVVYFTNEEEAQAQGYVSDASRP